MLMADPVHSYAARYDVEFIDLLGSGKDGQVLRTSDRRAVKFFGEESSYRRELRAYQILRARDIQQIREFQVPQFIRHDDDLQAVEMTIVDAPYILDFAAAYMPQEYERFEFSAEVLEETEARWSENFGERWPAARDIVAEFRRLTGLILLDLSLNNIRFTS